MKRTTIKLQRSLEAIEEITLFVPSNINDRKIMLDHLQDHLVANYDICNMVTPCEICWSHRILTMIDSFNIKSNKYHIDLDDNEPEIERLIISERKVTCKTITR